MRRPGFCGLYKVLNNSRERFSPQLGGYYDKNNVKLFRKFIYFVVKFLSLSPETMLLDAIHTGWGGRDILWEGLLAPFSGRGGRATGGGASGGPLNRRVRLLVPSRLAPVRSFVFFASSLFRRQLVQSQCCVNSDKTYLLSYYVLVPATANTCVLGCYVGFENLMDDKCNCLERHG